MNNMSIRRSIILLLAFVASCDGAGPPTTQQATPLKLDWDVSVDNKIQRVAWSRHVADHVWLIDGPGVVHLKIRGGIEHDVAFTAAQVWREGSRIKTIRLIREIGTVSDVYADSIKLANDWQINDRADIELFHKTNALRITSGQSGLYYARGGDELVQGRSIEIRKSFDSASRKPYVALVAFGFVPDYDETLATRSTSHTGNTE